MFGIFNTNPTFLCEKIDDEENKMTDLQKKLNCSSVGGNPCGVSTSLATCCASALTRATEKVRGKKYHRGPHATQCVCQCTKSQLYRDNICFTIQSSNLNHQKSTILFYTIKITKKYMQIMKTMTENELEFKSGGTVEEERWQVNSGIARTADVERRSIGTLLSVTLDRSKLPGWDD